MIDTATYSFTEQGKDLSQFFTSPKLAKKMVDWAELSRGTRVLEPSAGDGGIARFVNKNTRLTCIEADPAMVGRLNLLVNHPSMEVIQADFLKVTPARDAYDVAIMNPPYEEGADGQHVAHALRFASRVIVLVRANFEFGTKRFYNLYRWATVTRRAVLVRRPLFYGPGCQGHTARHEYVVLELTRRETDRVVDPSSDPVETEFWTESWGQ